MTPAPVLKASGHVDRFTDFMVTDVVTGALLLLHVVSAGVVLCAVLRTAVSRPSPWSTNLGRLPPASLPPQQPRAHKQTHIHTPNQPPHTPKHTHTHTPHPPTHPQNTHPQPPHTHTTTHTPQTGDCYRADHLLEACLEGLLEDAKAPLAPAARKEAENLLAGVGELKCEELGAAIVK